MFFGTQREGRSAARRGEIAGLRVSAVLVNALMAVLLIRAVSWLTVYVVLISGEPEQVLVRSGLLLIGLLLVATSLTNALFLLRPPAAVENAKSAIRVLNIVSLAILLSLALPVWAWLIQRHAEFISHVLTSPPYAERFTQIVVFTLAPIVIIALGYTQLHRRIRVSSAHPAEPI
jgi:hypothetical protein